jgi:E3 ubiquitin-protein ligase SHPRH
LKIEKDEPAAKTLIFSSWTDVLSLISKALLENSINHVLLKTGPKYAHSLEHFKKSEDVKALLLPISLGAKGLNLVEATHVFLVEPLLNPANEVQAVGRIHRIGQTKVTTVHRFLVKDTIEERIYEMFGSKSDQLTDEASFTVQTMEVSENASITLNDIHELFTT